MNIHFNHSEPSRHQRPMALRIRAALAAIRPSRDDGRHVHFHTGPQAQPVPCFDLGCPNPRLNVEADA